ncbi:MAG: 5-oxoprolinase subunit PxpB [Rhodospirillales bacterium]|nr:5-oxoprolinase subunit PxpB [Rhodospirillales bacterium]
MNVRFLDMGDRAFTIELDSAINPRAKARVASLDAALSAAGLDGITGTTQAFRSLTVHYDPLRARRADIQAGIEGLLCDIDATPEATPTRWALPISYDEADAPDLDAVARATGVSPDQVVEIHAGCEFLVYMLGFLPGFPFMGDLPDRLHVPRRAEPRVRVPSGSVAITGSLSAIYPWESPGGWNLIGRCPVPLFDVTRSAPALLAANDRVCFQPVTAAEAIRIEKAIRGGEVSPDSFREVVTA